MEITIRSFDMDYLDAGWKYVEEACGSDYSGSLYSRANYEWFREEYRGHSDVVILYGDFFGYGIGYNPETQDDRLKEIIDALSDYPCVDEEMVSLVEQRWIQDAMESWALKDFRHEVEYLFGDEILEDISDNTLAKIFEICRQEAEQEWESENCGMHIKIVKMAPYFEVVVSNMPVHA